MQIEACIGCGIETDKIDGAVHKYLKSSPGCWAKFGEILSKEYGDYEYMSVHGLTVDAYALQHPGTQGPQTLSSANVHLASLYSYFELGKPMSELSNIKQEIIKHKSSLVWLEPPKSITEVTVADILDSGTALQHCDNVKKWAAYVYEEWKFHHSAISSILSLKGT
ncbi:MAG: hypothetical protein COB20_15520 [SAR86 cluster bacterium]|uniref:Uncharacterized protein n=1 Tax=SAR86 cluster bacterium TaxID=2030880 RepID=A0A2A4WV29_9GAMM|nr:MAG: hypothetical protein COB20_15520 [SAR86 cluster bacterium]